MNTYLKNPTSKAFLLSSLLSSPFWGVFDLLPIILCKELGASLFQITTMIALKPLTALFAFYWGNSSHNSNYKLTSKLKFSYALKFLPFIFFPFFSNPWILIVAFGFHMFLLRGTIAPWMEILKINDLSGDQGKVCSIGSTINYVSNASLPIFFGFILDLFQGSWRWLFVITSLVGLCSIWFISKIPKSPSGLDFEKNKPPLSSLLLKPWKDSHRILRKNPNFLRFQIGFFLGGAGLMIIHPVLPKYLSGTLQLSYTKLMLATCFCKGIGFVVSSPFWVKLFNRISIFNFSSKVPLLAALFPLALILSKLQTHYVFIAYLLYGIMQGGSELGWKMSGPVFSKKDDSTPYSSINVLAVGIRGCIFPYFGTLLFSIGNVYYPLILGGVFCLSAGAYLWKTSRDLEKVPIPMP